MKYRVIKEILFDCLNKDEGCVTFTVNSIISYRRVLLNMSENGIIIQSHTIPSTFSLTKYNWDYVGKDFDIENYVRPLTDKEEQDGSLVEYCTNDVQNFIKDQQEWNKGFQKGLEFGKNCEEPYHIQVKTFTLINRLNECLNTIPGKDVIDIKCSENNYYLTYKVYDKEK